MTCMKTGCEEFGTRYMLLGDVGAILCPEHVCEFQRWIWTIPEGVAFQRIECDGNYLSDLAKGGHDLRTAYNAVVDRYFKAKEDLAKRVIAWLDAEPETDHAPE